MIASCTVADQPESKVTKAQSPTLWPDIRKTRKGQPLRSKTLHRWQLNRYRVVCECGCAMSYGPATLFNYNGPGAL